MRNRRFELRCAAPLELRIANGKTFCEPIGVRFENKRRVHAQETCGDLIGGRFQNKFRTHAQETCGDQWCALLVDRRSFPQQGSQDSLAEWSKALA